MQDLFFYLFSALTLICGALVVFNPFSRNVVTSAMFLVLTMMSLAGLFVLLHAFFLAVVQIIVYAGAVIVLFLFVIMLLDIEDEARRKVRFFSGGIAGIVGLALANVIVQGASAASSTVQAGAPTLEGGAGVLGKALFTQYVLPFEIVSVLLLVAMIGVILLSKKELK